ncbi:hypothetical protein [Salsipaludibacter albus]|uniref:AbiU2 domain-containing protein n=1 Tax=Salsipaludibacter albus TaxID=2849650 RepID=UPI001EE4C95F|nr:hypothetical protein [Salsipaludibacter albus]MBY5163147.1 hypothetical protein [Salsipaludibacter albus]
MLNQQAVAKLDDAAGMFNEALIEVSAVNHGRALIADIEPLLASKFENYAPFIRQWHNDSVVAACGRLLDATKGVRSVVKALDAVAALAPRIDYEGIVAVRRRASQRSNSQDSPVPPESPWERAAKSTVRHDQERLQSAHTEVKKARDEVVAHRQASFHDGDGLKVGGELVPDELLDSVLGDLHEIARKWHLYLLGWAPPLVRPSTETQTYLMLALTLFEPGQYLRSWIDARARLDRHFGLGERPADVDDTYQEAVEVHFVWPDPYALFGEA